MYVYVSIQMCTDVFRIEILRVVHRRRFFMRF